MLPLFCAPPSVSPRFAVDLRRCAVIRPVGGQNVSIKASAGSPETVRWSSFIEFLEPDVTGGRGKLLLPTLNLVVAKEIESVREKAEMEKMLISRRQAELISQQAELEKRLLSREMELLSEVNKGLIRENDLLRKSGADLQLRLLEAKGLNDTRGLFEMMEESLREVCKNKGARGINLWKDILKNHVALAECVQKHTKVSSTNQKRQAMLVYNIYGILSGHVHAGKELAQLRAERDGVIVFHRGPLSGEQVNIFKCVADAAKISIEEYTRTP